jgi:hypothetical protein
MMQYQPYLYNGARLKQNKHLFLKFASRKALFVSDLLAARLLYKWFCDFAGY